MPGRCCRSVTPALSMAHRDVPVGNYGAGVRPFFASVNRSLTVVPRDLRAAMQSMMISASITAYSTAVGPFSETRKVFTRSTKVCIFVLVRNSLGGEPACENGPGLKSPVQHDDRSQF